jgi:ankyrin repeat protein
MKTARPLVATLDPANSCQRAPHKISTLRWLAAAALSSAIASPAHPISSNTRQIAMSSISAVFFPSGIQSTLEEAIRSDDVAGINRALASGAAVNATGKQGVTPLMIAVDAQKLDAVGALLQARADPNLKAIDGNSAVSLATENYAAKPNGHDIMLAVMHGGGDPNTLRPDRDPVIRRFINDHDLEDVRLFKSLGANLDIIGRGNEPLITSVALAQDWDAVWCLIELGARYDYENGKSTQPLSDALNLKFPAPDSPMYPFKLKVWQLMSDKGLPVKPLRH